MKVFKKTGRANIAFYHTDCLPFMKEKPDKYYALAIVDPPYGLDSKLVVGAGKEPMGKYRDQYAKNSWDTVPTQAYFDELFRVSTHQIIWGGNYFNLPPTRGIICWDKRQMMPTFSRWEYAWSSFDKPAKMFEFFGNNVDRFHITEKPYELYEWLLCTYAQEGWNILDTFGGSGSIAHACWDRRFDLDLCEIDEQYFTDSWNRFERHTQQMQLF